MADVSQTSLDVKGMRPLQPKYKREWKMFGIPRQIRDSFSAKKNRQWNLLLFQRGVITLLKLQLWLWFLHDDSPEYVNEIRLPVAIPQLWLSLRCEEVRNESVIIPLNSILASMVMRVLTVIFVRAFFDAKCKWVYFSPSGGAGQIHPGRRGFMTPARLFVALSHSAEREKVVT